MHSNKHEENGLSGVALKTILSNSWKSYNFGDISLLEGKRNWSRTDEQGNHVAPNISGAISKNIRLHLPVVTAPMPDVTDATIAIVAARQGAIGIIPATYKPKEQADKVKLVKRAEGGFIKNPFTLSPNDAVAIALEAAYSNIPIVYQGKLVGMFISKQYGEYFYRNSKHKPLHTAMQKSLKKISANARDVTENKMLNLKLAQQLMVKRGIPALVVLDDNGAVQYLVTMKDVESKEKTYIYATRDKQDRLRVGAAILEYMTPQNLRRIKMLVEAEVDLIIIEQAQAWNTDAEKMTRYLKNKYPHIDVAVGNDSVGGAVEFHYANGADSVKVGQGPGSECISGEKIGLWRPQMSAVFECSKVARQNSIPSIADGGIKNATDIFKALAAGASSVMLGRLVAQTKDSPAKEIEPGKKMYRAMGSPEIAKTSPDAYQKYSPKTFIPEGTFSMLPITTSCETFLKNCSANLQRIFERFGVYDLKELHERLYSGTLRAQFAHDTSTK